MVIFARDRKLPESVSAAAVKQGRVAFDSWGGLSSPIHSCAIEQHTPYADARSPVLWADASCA